VGRNRKRRNAFIFPARLRPSRSRSKHDFHVTVSPRKMTFSNFALGWAR
jgi:hypothetical protein